MKKETTKREAHAHTECKGGKRQGERDCYYLEPDRLCKSGHKLRTPPKLQIYLHDNWKYDNISSEMHPSKKWIQCTQTTDNSGCMKNVLLMIFNVLHLYMHFNMPLWLWS